MPDIEKRYIDLAPGDRVVGPWDFGTIVEIAISTNPAPPYYWVTGRVDRGSGFYDTYGFPVLEDDMVTIRLP